MCIKHKNSDRTERFIRLDICSAHRYTVYTIRPSKVLTVFTHGPPTLGIECLVYTGRMSYSCEEGWGGGGLNAVLKLAATPNSVCAVHVTSEQV
jgi:hypothetical protein